MDRLQEATSSWVERMIMVWSGAGGRNGLFE